MRSNALNREFLERQPRKLSGLQFSNKRRRHACRYRIVLRHSESSIGAATATKQPPAFKAGTQEIRSARRAAAVIPLYGLTSAADRVKWEMARPLRGGRTDAIQLLVQSQKTQTTQISIRISCQKL